MKLAQFHVAAAHNAPPAFAELRRRQPEIRSSGVLARFAVAKQLRHITDCTDDFVSASACRRHCRGATPESGTRVFINYRQELLRPIFGILDLLLDTNFNSTALCSPTRAAIITGRNHHSMGFGVISEQSTGYPGYNSVMTRDKATIGKILKDRGYWTSWFSKEHKHLAVPDKRSRAIRPVAGRHGL